MKRTIDQSHQNNRFMVNISDKKQHHKPAKKPFQHDKIQKNIKAHKAKADSNIH